MSKYTKGNYIAVVEHSPKDCAINLYIQNTKLGCGLIIPRSTKIGTEYHTTTHSNIFGATTETDKRGIYDEQKIFNELTELGKDIVDFMALCDCQKNLKGANYDNIIIDEAKLCKAAELPKPELMDYNPVKKYLKWEDLEFTDKIKTLWVKLGDNAYKMQYYKWSGFANKVVIFSDKFIEIYDNKFFNDLHLERVEE